MSQDPGQLLIFHDVAAGHEEEVRRWYAREHHFERLSIPGFLSVHRYDRLAGSGGAMLCVYGSSDPAVFFSPPYRARLAAPTPATRACMPHFRCMSRTETRLAAQVGRGEGGCLGVAVMDGAEAPGWAAAISGALAGLVVVPRVLRLRTLIPVMPETMVTTAETELRRARDARVGAAVLIDAEDPFAAQAVLDQLVRAAGPAGPTSMRTGTYRLAFAARSEEA